MTHIDIVIISWAKNSELHEVTKRGIESLIQSENENIIFHVYVIESNHNINYDEFNTSLHTCETIHPNEKFGYHKFLNIGRRAGKSPYVALCNSDLTYEKGWASEIINIMENYPQFLSASPWCPQTQGSNEIQKNQVYPGRRVRMELAGWCIFQQRKIYDIIKELDENFTFWYCDNDYSMELEKNNIQHCLVCNSVVNHHEFSLGKTGRSLDETIQKQITIDQEKIFNKKWSKYLSLK